VVSARPPSSRRASCGPASDRGRRQIRGARLRPRINVGRPQWWRPAAALVIGLRALVRDGTAACAYPSPAEQVSPPRRADRVRPPPDSQRGTATVVVSRPSEELRCW